MSVLSSRVLLHPADLARSRRFYEGALGLHVYREWGPPDAPIGIVYFIGGGFLELSAGAPANTPPAGFALWLQVPDATSATEACLAGGGTLLHAVERKPWGLIEGWVADPDGVELHLVEIPPEHPLRRR